MVVAIVYDLWLVWSLRVSVLDFLLREAEGYRICRDSLVLWLHVSYFVCVFHRDRNNRIHCNFLVREEDLWSN